jgi:secreted trypsin-like serine protease
VIGMGMRGRLRPSRWVGPARCASRRAVAVLRAPRRLGSAVALFATAVVFAVVGGAPAFAITGGAAVSDGSKGFVAKLQIGDTTSCAGVLVAPQWVLTSASCFATAAGPAPGGPPPVRTLVTLGRNDLSGTGGHTPLAIKLVPRTDRDAVLVQLDTAITDVAPIALASAGPAVGDTLRTATFGRTATEWVPNQLQSALFQVTSLPSSVTVGLAGSGDAVSLCKGDAGGPLFSEAGGTPALVAINTVARAHGCLDSTETRTGGTATLVADLGSWIQSTVAASPNGYYKPVTPTRILDTRTGTGTSGNTTTPVPANTALTLQITGKNGVPASDVTAVALTVTSVGQSGNGTITAYPDQVARPGTSNVNYTAGVAVANFVILAVGANGAIDLYNATSSTHLLADLAGYFTVDYTGASSYTPIVPKRFLDTRTVTGGRLGNGGSVTVAIGGVNSIPTANLAAVAVTLTAVKPGGGGYLTAYAHGATRPATSNLQYGTSSRAISAIVPVSADGKFDVWTSVNTDVLVDVAGYFTTDNTGMTFHPATPARLEDTRASGNPIPANGTVIKPPFVHVAQAPAATAAAAPASTPASVIMSAALYNVTVVAPASAGYLVNYPYGVATPDTSNILFSAGQVIPNLILAPLSWHGDTIGFATTTFYNASATSTNVILDYFGSFTQDAPITPPAFNTDGSIVEDGAYPDAAAIEAAQNIRLISGDGHIQLADCATTPVNNVGVMKVWTTELIGPDGQGLVCFKVTASTGVLNLFVPGVYEIRGDGQHTGSGHQGTAEVTTDAGVHTTVTLNPSGSTQVGIGTDPDADPTTLLQLRVTG